jgi:Xaa-Pro aminopeptidase
MNYAEHAIVRDETLDYTHYPLEHDFPLDEYRLRVTRARAEMARAGLDALVITSGQVGWWFTGRDEPHSWHDQVPSRSTWYILTPDHDYLYMTPTNNHNFASARRGTWVFYDLEDQYVVTERGAECLHEPAPEELPVVGG